MTEGRKRSATSVHVVIRKVLSSVFSVILEEYNSNIQEKLPLIIGSAAAGLVFIVAIAVLIIVCRR